MAHASADAYQEFTPREEYDVEEDVDAEESCEGVVIGAVGEVGVPVCLQLAHDGVPETHQALDRHRDQNVLILVERTEMYIS